MPNGGERTYEPGKPRIGTASAGRRVIAIRRRTYKVHRLICDAFHGPRPFPEAEVLHENEDGLDNRPSNLRWGTREQNMNAPGYLAYCRGRIGADSPRTKWARQRAGGF
jgi:hypothetical protein